MKSLRSWLSNSPARGRKFRPLCERLEAREVPSSSAPKPPNDLSNPLVASIADAEFRQDAGQLSRGDVINLLDVLDGTESAVFTNGKVSFIPATPDPNGKVTKSELIDLRAVVGASAAWHLSAPVANLLGKTVNFNPANENFQGAPLLSSGKLTNGSPTSVLQDLVGKWFYGADLPDTAAAVIDDGIPDNVVYQTAQGVLFGAGGHSPNDIAQGWLGDCYFMSSLGEVAKQSPRTIQSMFINNGDGTYTVRFFDYDANNNTWHPDYVTVNLELPVMQSTGQLSFAGWYQSGRPTTYTDTSAVLWPSLAEKAYAQLAEEGWSRSENPGGSGIDSTPGDWNANSYDALNAGDGVAMQQIGGSNITYDVGLANATTADEKALEAAFAHGTLVIIGSLDKEPANTPKDSSGAPLIIQTHVYDLVGVNASKGTFTLINPLDDSVPYPGDGQREVTLTWSQMKKYLRDYFETSPPPIDPSHAVIQKGDNTGINGGAAPQDIQWYVNGKAVSSVSKVKEGDTVTVTFTLAANAPTTEFSLVSYAAPNGNFDSWNIDHQQEWADSTGTFSGAGNYSLTVTVPDGYFQLDFVRGAAIDDFATGERYHTDGVFIAGVQGGDHLIKF